MGKGGGKKTSKNETQQVNQVDPALRKEHHNMVNAFKGLIGAGPRPINESVSIADFTPAQKAAMEMNNAGASAFGFDVPAAGAGMPKAERSATGIMGFAPGREARDIIDDMEPNRINSFNRFFDELGSKFKDKKPKGSSGGGKKGGGGKK